ncbi:hypothetical protein ACUJ40_11020 [Halococcus saccharolyticus]
MSYRTIEVNFVGFGVVVGHFRSVGGSRSAAGDDTVINGYPAFPHKHIKDGSRSLAGRLSIAFFLRVTLFLPTRASKAKVKRRYIYVVITHKNGT